MCTDEVVEAVVVLEDCPGIVVVLICGVCGSADTRGVLEGGEGDCPGVFAGLFFLGAVKDFSHGYVIGSWCANKK